MNHARLDKVIADGVSAGILPAGTTRLSVEHRPWPVMLLTGLGAWLAAIPFIGLAFVTMGDTLADGICPYFVGVAFLIGAISILINRNLPLFVEQLAIPALLAGGATLGFGLWNDIHAQVASVLLALAAVGIALAIPQQWLRIMLGAASCILMMFAIWPGSYAGTTFQHWLALHALLAVWIAARWRTMPMAFESLATGWGIALLAGLAVWTGMTFLLDASLQFNDGATSNLHMPEPEGIIAQAISAALAGLAVVAISRRWPTMHGPWFLASGVILAAMSFMMPSLGAVLLVIAVAAGQQRWRTAIAGGLAAAWIIGAFYYQAALPLTTKALIMVLAGGLLGAIAALALRGHLQTPVAGPVQPGSLAARLSIAACALAVLLVANIGIAQKESLIANGQPVFVELAPVDPRSLMQGDFMRLAYRLPDVEFQDRSPLPGATRLRVIGTLDARRVFTATRIADSKSAAIAAGELAIALTPSASGWTIAADAWYFKEGEAGRWSNARYGEFRIDGQGRALLVGLRGPQLEAL